MGWRDEAANGMKEMAEVVKSIEGAAVHGSLLDTMELRWWRSFSKLTGIVPCFAPEGAVPPESPDDGYEYTIPRFRAEEEPCED